MRITGVIKGSQRVAILAAEKHGVGIKILHTQSVSATASPCVTVEFPTIEQLPAISDWFNETTLPIPIGGFPDGTLLIISRHEGDVLPSEIPLTQPAGLWTVCRCNHIAQEHGPNGKCEECKCQAYTGHFVPWS